MFQYQCVYLLPIGTDPLQIPTHLKQMKNMHGYNMITVCFTLPKMVRFLKVFKVLKYKLEIDKARQFEYGNVRGYIQDPLSCTTVILFLPRSSDFINDPQQFRKSDWYPISSLLR